MTKLCGAFPKWQFFMLSAVISDFGRHLGFWPPFWKKRLQKYSHNSSIKPINFELSNFKTKKKMLTTTAYHKLNLNLHLCVHGQTSLNYATFTLLEFWIVANILTYNIVHPVVRFHIGYRASRPYHAPPPEWSWVGSFFSYGCLVPPKFFPPKKVDFVGDIKG